MRASPLPDLSLSKGKRGWRSRGIEKVLFLQINFHKMRSIHFKQKLKEYAREHRNQGTKGEAILWKYVLKNKKTGYTFNRQFVIDKYIVDFISRKLNLIIEIDGSSHLGKEKSKYDFEREQYLIKMDIQLFVLKNMR